MGRVTAFACAVMLICLGVMPSKAEKRVALVIGNSAYRDVPPLANPANDGKLMADTLRALGFSLVGGKEQLDLDKTSFERAVQDFGIALQGADVVLFYYAGHGVQVRGLNYLMPVDAEPTEEADVDLQLLDINAVLGQMEGAGMGLKILILDACRNYPFREGGQLSADKGLAPIQASENTLISFATQPGAIALDGADRNSPFAKALAQALPRPGLELFETFNEVGLAVMRTTGRKQQPWLSVSPTKTFYFAGRADAPGAASALVAPSARPASAAGVSRARCSGPHGRIRCARESLSCRRGQGHSRQGGRNAYLCGTSQRHRTDRLMGARRLTTGQMTVNGMARRCSCRARKQALLANNTALAPAR